MPIHALSWADAIRGDRLSNLRVRGSKYPTAWAVVPQAVELDVSGPGALSGSDCLLRLVLIRDLEEIDQ
jgi:hypothetical protein